MEAWQIILTIFGVVTIVTGGVVKIFTSHHKTVKSADEPKVLISSHPSSPNVHTLDNRLSRLEERVTGHDREVRDLKSGVEKNENKTAKLSELLIEWLQKGRSR